MVMPDTAPVTVFDALLTGMPSTVSDAFFPWLGWVKTSAGSELSVTEPLLLDVMER